MCERMCVFEARWPLGLLAVMESREMSKRTGSYWKEQKKRETDGGTGVRGIQRIRRAGREESKRPAGEGGDEGREAINSCPVTASPPAVSVFLCEQQAVVAGNHQPGDSLSNFNTQEEKHFIYFQVLFGNVAQCPVQNQQRALAVH